MAICGAEHGKVCEKVDQLETECNTLFQKCDHLVNQLAQKVGFKIFMWLMGGLAIALTGVIGYTHAVDKDVARGTATIQVLQSDMAHVSKTVERIDRKLDRLNGKAKDD